jgi:hypothetical protein
MSGGEGLWGSDFPRITMGVGRKIRGTKDSRVSELKFRVTVRVEYNCQALFEVDVGLGGLIIVAVDHTQDKLETGILLGICCQFYDFVQ